MDNLSDMSMASMQDVFSHLLKDAIQKLCTQHIQFSSTLIIDGLICVSQPDAADVVVKVHRSVVKSPASDDEHWDCLHVKDHSAEVDGIVASSASGKRRGSWDVPAETLKQARIEVDIPSGSTHASRGSTHTSRCSTHTSRGSTHTSRDNTGDHGHNYDDGDDSYIDSTEASTPVTTVTESSQPIKQPGTTSQVIPIVEPHQMEGMHVEVKSDHPYAEGHVIKILSVTGAGDQSKSQAQKKKERRPRKQAPGNTETPPQVVMTSQGELTTKARSRCFLRTGPKPKHPIVKPYPCDECGRVFGYKHVLESHMRIHSGEMPYQCGNCGKRFNQRSNLKNHIQRIHSNEPVPPRDRISVVNAQGNIEEISWNALQNEMQIN